MKFSRHYLSSMFPILLVVSVLFCSCGIPSFCTLNGITINSKNTNDLSFSVSGTDSDLTLVEKGPGLLLMYTYGDIPTPYADLTNSTGIIKSFNSLAENKIYINANNSILDYKAGDNIDYTLYAFSNYINNTSVAVRTPSYNIDLRNAGYIENTSIKDNASFRLSKRSWTDDEIIIDINNSNDTVIQSLYVDLDNSTKQYIYVYAAFSAEVGDFSNIYWSKLKYLGTISKDSI